MSNPKISIAVPVHPMKNWEFFLSRLMKSLENQTYKNWQLLFSDDSPRDGTHEISRYLLKHEMSGYIISMLTEDRKPGMASNSNNAIKNSKGDIIKILYMDDYLINPDALQNLADNFKGGWYASGCVQDDGTQLMNEHMPSWNSNMKQGANTIGSPSVIAFENNEPLLFDENLSWLLDCELYDRLYKRYGEPTYQNTVDVAIGVGDHQMTNILTGEEKRAEHIYVSKL